MDLVISPEVRSAINAHAASTYPFECCGALLGKYSDDEPVVTEARRLQNTHADGHERRYLVDPRELRDLVEEERVTGQSILGFYHSHPDHPARPSGYDLEWACEWYTYVIVEVDAGLPGAMTAWRLNPESSEFDEVVMIEAARRAGRP